MAAVPLVSTAAGTLIRPTVAAIDLMLSSASSRYMFLPGDQDKLLDARLALTSGDAH
jgi:hypothetical protein